MIKRLLSVFVCALALSACVAEKSNYGVPPLTWQYLSPEQQKLIANQSHPSTRKSHET